MKNYERQFKDGEVIFREGDRGNSAFVIVSGQVELTKKKGRKSVRLALLSAGEMFGEMGVIDKSARSATARALGPVLLDMIEKDDFVASLEKRPDVALTVIGNLAGRLRETNRLFVEGGNPASPSQPARVGPRVGTRVGTRDGDPHPLSMQGILDAFFTRRASRERLLEIRVARLRGDEDGEQTGLVVGSFQGLKGIHAQAVEETFAVKPTEDLSTILEPAQTAGRKWLAREMADLLIWGEVNEIKTALQLRFISEPTWEDHPGSFMITDRLTLPADYSADYTPLLAAVALAATTPRGEPHRRLQKSLLLPTLEEAQEAGRQPPIELSLADQSTLQTCYGNVASLIGYQSSDPAWYRRAAQAYQDVLEVLPKEEASLDWASAQRHLGLVLQALGERGSDEEILTKAADAYRAALEVFSRATFPSEWAALQAKLGSTLYKLDFIRGDTEILKDAIGAFQSALRVFTRAGNPLRWSEAKNNMGQALQVWGDLARNAELLDRAVLCCQEALQVRTRYDTPLQWAATQNNLGSALFLLGKLTEDSEHLEGAAEAFGQALEIYQAHGAARLARVTERNMAKAEDMLRARLARKVATVYWEDEESTKRATSLGRNLRRRTAESEV